MNLRKSLHNYFKKRPEVRLAYLFGSQATGRTNRLSDVDVAVLANPSAALKNTPYGYKALLITDIMKALKRNDVDVVLLQEAPYFLRQRIITSGTPLYVKDELERIRFEADVMNRYPDI